MNGAYPVGDDTFMLEQGHELWPPREDQSVPASRHDWQPTVRYEDDPAEWNRQLDADVTAKHRTRMSEVHVLIHGLRALDEQLAHSDNPLRGVPSQAAARLRDLITAGVPAPPAAPSSDAKNAYLLRRAAEAAERGDWAKADALINQTDSGDRSCTGCGGPMPLGSTGRGRPRSKCLACSPPKKPGKNN